LWAKVLSSRNGKGLGARNARLALHLLNVACTLVAAQRLPRAPWDADVGSGGKTYVSKVDAFAEFVQRSKFPALKLAAAAGSKAVTTTSTAGRQGVGMPVAAATADGPSQTQPLDDCRRGGSQNSQQPLLGSDAAASQSTASQQGAPGATVPRTAPGAAVHHSAGGECGGTGSDPGSRHTSSGSGPQKQKLLLLDDLPHAHDAAARAVLAGLLRDLAATARCPVVIIATESDSGGGGGDGSSNRGAALDVSRGVSKVCALILAASEASRTG
jgi:hypothetical protein